MRTRANCAGNKAAGSRSLQPPRRVHQLDTALGCLLKAAQALHNPTRQAQTASTRCGSLQARFESRKWAGARRVVGPHGRGHGRRVGEGAQALQLAARGRRCAHRAERARHLREAGASAPGVQLPYEN